MQSSQRFQRGNFKESVQFASPVAAIQRVGPLAVIPGLLRELGADPDKVLASAGLDSAALNDIEGSIPYVALGRLLHACAFMTRCPNFALLVGQRAKLLHLGLPGELLRHSATLNAALLIFVRINAPVRRHGPSLPHGSAETMESSRPAIKERIR
jgi:hypothetical protein